MSKYFGTDGIRGVAGEELTARTAFALGNALCRLKRRPLVVVGQDTRTSSDMLSLALSAGVTGGGRARAAGRGSAHGGGGVFRAEVRGRFRRHGQRIAQPARL